VAGFCVRDRKPEIEHQADRFIVGIGLPAIAGQEFEIETGQVGNNLGMLPGDSLRVLPAGENAAHKQADLRIAVFVEEIENLIVALEKRYLMGIRIESESPLQYGAATALVPDGCKIGQAADAASGAGGIFRNEFADEIAITERGSEKDIWSRSPIEQVPGNLGSFPNTPLGGRGIVVLIACVNFRAMIYKELSGGDVSGEMKGSATIAALGVDQRRIGTQ
jgi:hypothetical protein